MSREKIEVVNRTDEDDFKDRVNELLMEGYRISSTHCGFVDSKEYDYCSSFMAILIKQEAKNG